MSNTPAPTWSEERVALLRQLWRDWPASKIAKRLGLTRNAVIGKVSRLGLKKRPAVAAPRGLSR